MREFKFRAWDTEKDKMARVTHIGVEEGEVHMEDDDCWCWSAPQPYVCRLMQYTSLKDKNEKEIYEGDIVRAVKYTGRMVQGTMVFKNGSFCIKNDLITVYNLMDYEIEVLGNIYENKELLKSLNSFDEGGIIF